ncbi:MAG: M56 family metallopeptidase, partial [Eubacteriales bacterium]|nr:M56 family metallopeptidase [Eubacteriales bacterium]
MRSATIFNFLIEATLMGSVLILIVLLLRHFGRGRLGNRLIYFAWLLVALRLLVPIALPNPVMNELRPTLSDNLGVRPMADQVRVRLMDAMTDTAEAVGGGSVWGNSVSSAIFDFSCETSYGHTARWILLGYGVVGGLVIAAMTWQNVRFRRMLRRRRIERLSGQRLETYRALCEERHVKPLPVWLVDPLPSACLVGVFRPFIALPLSLTDAAFAQAVRHELCHHRAHDEAWGLLRNLCCAAHWFNPLVWLAAALSRIDAEMACDDRVTRGMSENARLAYVNALVTCAARKNVPGLNVLATGMTMKGKSLKLRVNAILHSRKVRRGALIAFGTVATAALLAAFATAEWITPIPLPDPPVAAAEGAPYLTRETRIADQEGALTFARDFLASEWIGLAPDELSLSLDSGENQTRWYLEAYDLTKALPIALDFDLYGCVYSYIDSSVYLDEAAPSPQALTEEEKQSVVSFVESFIRSRLPGVYGAYDAMEVYADETTADGRFLTLVTSSARTGELHRFVVQAAPRTRLISF